MRIAILLGRVRLRDRVTKFKEKSEAILADVSVLGHPLVGLDREYRVPALQQLSCAFQNPQLSALSVDFDVVGLR